MSNWAELEFPSEFLLGLDGLARAAKWRVRRDGARAYVTTAERYNKQSPALVKLRRIASPESAHDSRRYAVFGEWMPQDGWRGGALSDRVDALQEVRAPESETDLFVAFRLKVMTAADAEVAPLIREFYAGMASHFPQSSLWAVEFNEAVRWRIAAVRMLFGARQHPEALAAVHRSGRRLPTPMGLMGGLTFGLASLIEPALLFTSPWVLGVNATRASGQVVLLFGEAHTAFQAKQAHDLLDVLRGRVGFSDTTVRPELSSDVCEQWLIWWIDRLNILLGRALDVSDFVDQAGRYDPASQFGVLTSLERLFELTQLILADSRRPHDRLQRMFDVMDLLEGLSMGSWDSMLSPGAAERHLHAIEGALGPELSTVGLIRPRRAVAALKAFANDFVTSGSEQLVTVESAKTPEITLDAACVAYLRLLRNAGTHSFRKAIRDPFKRSVLASHTGEVPEELADLAALYLLRVLVDPRLPTH